MSLDSLGTQLSMSRNEEHPRLALTECTDRNPTTEERAHFGGEICACQTDGLDAQTEAHSQTSYQLSVSHSQEEQDSDLEPEYENGVFYSLYKFTFILTNCAALLIEESIPFSIGSFNKSIDLTGIPNQMAVFIYNYANSLLSGESQLGVLTMALCIIYVSPIPRRITLYGIYIYVYPIVGLILLGISGLLIWGLHTAFTPKRGSKIDPIDNYLFYPWYTGPVPHSFQGCNARVTPQQSPLFAEDIYKTQFHRMWHIESNEIPYNHTFDMELSLSIQRNATLCSQGFKGNDDLYGLGIRTGIYLQWIASLLANNLLSENRRELQKVYLIYSLAVCTATMISTFAVTCVFGIEIQVLYWMYWGGFLCVFALSPSETRLGPEAKWAKLDWVSVIHFIMHMLMTYHGIWFIWHAYDQVFSRMPCGTYQFFFVPVLDPSKSFWILRDVMTQLMCPLASQLLLLFPLFGLLFLAEVKQSIQDSAIYQMFFPKASNPDNRGWETLSSSPSAQLSPDSRVFQWLRRLHCMLRRLYRRFRRAFSLPPFSRSGIPLLTPINVRDQRYVAGVDRE